MFKLITTLSKRSLGIWLIAVSFVLFQFLLQMSSGLIIGSIMKELHWSAFLAGILGSAFYYVYTTLQIPVGILFDSRNTRTLLSYNALLCACGCFIFASSHHLSTLMLGRLMMGTGSAFAFVGLSHLLRQYFPIKHFGFWIGLSETISLTGIMLSTWGIGHVISWLGWRSFVYAAAAMGVGISFLCARYIPNHQPQQHSTFNRQYLIDILTNKLAWINGIFVGLSFSVISVFGGMWAIPFIEVKLSCSIGTASAVGSFIFLGTAISCPLFGKLSLIFPKRRLLMISSCLVTAILMLIILYLPFSSAPLLGLFIFLVGVSCGAYMLAFAIANELSPAESLSTCTGFTNTLAMLTAPLFQPLIGLLLDISKHWDTLSIVPYQVALSIIPLSLVIASGLVLLLPEASND